STSIRRPSLRTTLNATTLKSGAPQCDELAQINEDSPWMVWMP
ncbi:MAG: hypothetical protein QOF30_3195, partial [Acidimicrobiaceae bacterium]|nr:hypothetical protein [Acidimicrobiaceae bacterium]